MTLGIKTNTFILFLRSSLWRIFFLAGFFLFVRESSVWRRYHVEMAVFHDEVEIEDFEYDEVCQSTECKKLNIEIRVRSWSCFQRIHTWCVKCAATRPANSINVCQENPPSPHEVIFS